MLKGIIIIILLLIYIEALEEYGQQWPYFLTFKTLPIMEVILWRKNSQRF